MRRSLTIAKIAGVPIRVHWTFSLLVLLVFLSSSGMSSLAIKSYIIWLVILFTSVTLHELSHSLVAMRLGLKVHDIVLLPIGGVSEIEGMGSSPSVEGRVAIAGPLASILLGALFIGVAAATKAPIWPPNLSLTTGSWLSRIGWLNLALAAFNLLPALPMDGGRVLRSLLSRGGNPVLATRIAAVVAAVIAVGMIAFGLSDDDFLLDLIGVFVLFGASAEWQSAKVRGVLRGIAVASVMHAEPTTVPVTVRAGEVAGWLSYYPGRAVPVVDEVGRYVGIVAQSDLAGVLPDDPVGKAADRGAPLLPPTMDLFPDAAEAFQQSGRQQLAVGSDGRIVGVVYLPAVTSALLRARGVATPV